jgi:Zn-dependent metalloprotease
MTRAGIVLALAMGAPAVAGAQDAPALGGEAQSALAELTQANPTARVVARSGAVTALTGLAVEAAGQTARERAEDFVGRYAAVFGVTPGELRYASTQERRGRQTVRFTQVHGDLTVEGRALTLAFDAQGRVRRVSSDLADVRELARGPVSADAAVAAATESVHGAPEARLSPTAPELVVLATDGAASSGVVAWKVPVVGTPMTGHVFVFVDTRDARVLAVTPTAIID